LLVCAQSRSPKAHMTYNIKQFKPIFVWASIQYAAHVDGATIHVTSPDERKLEFGDGTTSFATLSGGEGYINSTVNVYAPDFVTMTGTSVNEMMALIREQQVTLVSQQVEIAALKEFVGLMPPPSPPPPPPFSCRQHRHSGITTDGVYTIDFGATPFPAFCDMTRDGGGWTLLLTQTSATANFAGSVNPFGAQTLNEQSPSVSTPYVRDWTASGVGVNPLPGDEFMIVHTDSDWVSMTVSTWCGWESTSGCGAMGRTPEMPGYATGTVYSSTGSVLLSSSNFASCCCRSGCSSTGGDTAAFSTNVDHPLGNYGQTAWGGAAYPAQFFFGVSGQSESGPMSIYFREQGPALPS